MKISNITFNLGNSVYMVSGVSENMPRSSQITILNPVQNSIIQFPE